MSIFKAEHIKKFNSFIEGAKDIYPNVPKFMVLQTDFEEWVGVISCPEEYKEWMVQFLEETGLAYCYRGDLICLPNAHDFIPREDMMEDELIEILDTFSEIPLLVLFVDVSMIRERSLMGSRKNGYTSADVRLIRIDDKKSLLLNVDVGEFGSVDLPIKRQITDLTSLGRKVAKKMTGRNVYGCFSVEDYSEGRDKIEVTVNNNNDGILVDSEKEVYKILKEVLELVLPEF